jgi:uroporphyrinogen decarboxylase
LRKELGEQTALIGFSGSPWTLATFMMEGGSAEKFTKAKALFASDKKTFSALMEKLTAAVTAYLQMQIAAGADALQIFDSHGGHLPAADFQEASGRWMKEIIANLRAKVPVTVFSLGTHGNWNDLAATGANVLGIDWKFSLAEARKFCRKKSASKAISIPRCSPRRRRKKLPLKPIGCSRKCAGATATFSISVTACRRRQSWKISPHWSRL